MNETEPAKQKVKASDVKPYRWGIWCTVGGHPKPFTNGIVSVRWSVDGEKLWFMLDSHNFQDAAPDEMLDLVPMEDTRAPEWRRRVDDEHATMLANRPRPGPTLDQQLAAARKTLDEIADWAGVPFVDEVDQTGARLRDTWIVAQLKALRAQWLEDRAERDAHRKALNEIADLLAVVHEDDKIVDAVKKLRIQWEKERDSR